MISNKTYKTTLITSTLIISLIVGLFLLFTAFIAIGFSGPTPFGLILFLLAVIILGWGIFSLRAIKNKS